MAASKSFKVSDVLYSFIKFLQLRGAYEAWCAAGQEVRGFVFWADVACVIEDGDCSGLLSGMFFWEATPQGHDYWKDLSDEWDGICLKWKR